MKQTYHFQIGAPTEVVATAHRLRGAHLKYGPHANQRWTDKFGALTKPTQLPATAQWIEATVFDNQPQPIVDTVLFRFACDTHTDVMMSVAVKTKFVCSVWRVPKWFGLGEGRPRDPRKYVSPRRLDGCTV